MSAFALFLQIAVALLLVWHRVLILGLPYYVDALEKSLWANIICGLASDLSFIFLFSACVQAVELFPGPSMRRRVGLSLAFFGMLAIAFLLAVHVRYVEYFGMTARPLHFLTLFEWDILSVGIANIVDTWLPFYLVAGSMAGGLLATVVIQTLMREKWSKVSRIVWLCSLLLLSALLHSLMLNMRFMQGVHGELRYNPFFALFLQLEEYGELKVVRIPSLEEYRDLRTQIPGKRSWSGGELGAPLWQYHLAQAPFVSSHAKKTFEKLRDHIASFESINVVVAIQESLRAHEIAASGGLSQDAPWLSRHISSFLREGVQFRETLSIKHGTGPGQVAALCSVASWPELELLKHSPLAKLVCLPNLFADLGYETAFFYPDNNNFDNQSQFYTAQGISRMIDKYSFPEGTPRAGWGVSDLALLNKALDTFATMKKPFFGVALTLSNHGPLRLPADAPASIRKDVGMRKQLIQYVDWVWGQFYNRLAREFPNTLVVFIADHGTNEDIDPSSSDDPRRIVRQSMRIPFAFWMPNLPAELRGVSLEHPVSNLDLAPTLLSLIGWDGPQQFVGLNAFMREDAGFPMNWRGEVHMVSAAKDEYAWQMQPMDQRLAEVWQSLMQLDSYAPSGFRSSQAPP